MPLGGAAAEALLEPLQELVGQRDFGQQDQHLRMGLAQRLRDRLEIDLGFARAGDAIQQRRAKAALGDALAELGRRRRLALAQIRLAEIGLGSQRTRARKLCPDQATRLREPVDHGSTHLGRVHQPLLGPHRVIGEHRQNALARRRHARRRGPAQPEAPARLLGLEHEPGAHHHLQHHALGRERVVRDPIGEGEVDRRQRRHVERRHDGLEFLGVERLAFAALAPDHADALHRPQRHHHEAAGRKRLPVRNRVGVRLFQRQRQQHRHRAGGGTLRRRLPGASRSKRESSVAGIAEHSPMRGGIATAREGRIICGFAFQTRYIVLAWAAR